MRDAGSQLPERRQLYHVVAADTSLLSNRAAIVSPLRVNRVDLAAR